MPLSEIGILPQSTGVNFTPPKPAASLFFHVTHCGHLFCSREYYIKRDSFPPLLLAYIRAGTLCVETGGQHYEASSGQVLLLDCTEPHHYYAKADGLEFLYVHFDGANSHELCRYITQSCGILIHGPQNSKIEAALLDMLDFYESGETNTLFASSLRLYQILSLFDDAIKSPCLRKNDDSIYRSIVYIRTHVGKKIALHQLAQIAGLSDYYFSRLFKEMTGFSPTEFVINTRIDQAKVLLTSTSLSILEISKQVGYPNSSNLITHFIRRVGMSPTQYRKNMTNQSSMS